VAADLRDRLRDRGVAIAMEVLTAFFLEAGFLGLLVFGEGRIGKRMMLFATCMVSLGTIRSVTWIMVGREQIV
jgi:cytochrome d ubiquinol oxidase subunit I